jgi:hypothetical protein
MPGLVKIGMTTQEDIDKRMKELYTTGVPIPFECQFACKVKKGDCAKIEKALHTAFAPQRINANREFFRIQVEQAKAILELFHHTDVTEEVSDEIENDLTDDDKAASAKAQIHRPPLNFYEMGMQKGDVLQWKDDPTITVTIVSALTKVMNRPIAVGTTLAKQRTIMNPGGAFQPFPKHRKTTPILPNILQAKRALFAIG